MLNIADIAANPEENPEWNKSVLNVQKRHIEVIETDSRKLYNEIDKTILDLVHNRI